MKTIVLGVDVAYIAICCIYVIVLLIGGFLLKYNKYKYNKNKPNCQMSFAIILPVYREQKRMQSCINNIEKIDYKKDKIKIFICTTEKEPIDGNDTESICRTLLEDGNVKFSYEIIRYPYLNGNMAEQVNYVYERIKGQFDVYSIYNADSVINSDSFKEAEYKFLSTDAKYIQQRAIYNNNVGKNIFSIGYNTYQSSFEMRNNIIGDMCCRGRNVVGRALFIKNDEDMEYIYPTEFFCEDIALSFKLTSNDVRIGGLTCFEINEPPVKLLDMINQQFVWFHTAVQVRKLTKYAKESRFINHRILLKILNRLVSNFLWICISAVTFFAMISNPWMILAIFVYCALITLELNIFYSLNRGKYILIDAIGMMIYLLVASLGTYKYIVKKIMSLVGYKKVDVKYKTPR